MNRYIPQVCYSLLLITSLRADQQDTNFLYLNTFHHPELKPAVLDSRLFVRILGVEFTPNFGSVDRSAGTITTTEHPIEPGAVACRPGCKLTVVLRNVTTEPLHIESFHFDYYRAWGTSPSAFSVTMQSYSAPVEIYEAEALPAGSALCKVSNYQDHDVILGQPLTLEANGTVEFCINVQPGTSASTLIYVDNLAIIGNLTKSEQPR